jgi:dihydropteroate synthase
MAPTPHTFAGLTLDRPLLMGVVNVTPDSFSDGGEALRPEDAIARGRALLDAGADILDIGGESTRPGAAPVPVEDEIARVLPVVAALSQMGGRVSIDTRRARVMAAAMAAGARIINDVTALAGDPESLALAAKAGVAVILMHMQGEPRTMQENPRYDDVVAEVRDYLAARIEACAAAGIARERIAIDPGIGFGKTVEHNLSLLKHLDRLVALGCPVVLGVSRKSFVAKLSYGEPPKARLPGSLAAALAGVARGAAILRVHDVAETRQALSVWRAIAAADS